ncbi:short-chain dehydrogenase [Cucurbitaria berberidis CBS 394.84]|uniref:Short-chain dehydrogenase n=1 Tax=Cucurbitaria berberidis CBS 394.84 TaxID=1168544 RepID=A0A9P4G7S9_9PLEO|nr:short-chain dehydrogenase [Cucurbitaria berberidis CBS 394.84]KAF1840309.1 short-chain dehydrogenase [Cucurbitaria berberidis CBS 394.84]
MGNQISQAYPPAAKFTETSLGDLKGKVYIVTGANAGVGKELARILYSRNGTVYVGARNSEKAKAAIAWIKESHPTAQGALHYLHLDLNDLEGIKPSVEEFLSKEKRLDVLFNNAGVMVPPQGSKTKQGYELQLGTNCVAPFLFTKLLTPLLAQTVKSSPAGSVRVIWVSSSAAHLGAPTGGVDLQNLDYHVDKWASQKYAVSKGGNVLHAVEFQRRYKQDGIVSVSLNPGNLASDLQRHISPLQAFFVSLMVYPAVNGAYTELFAGLSPDVASIKQNEWVIPFGRICPLRKDLAQAGLLEEDGGSGIAKKFWEWTEEQVARYA